LLVWVVRVHQIKAMIQVAVTVVVEVAIILFISPQQELNTIRAPVNTLVKVK